MVCSVSVKPASVCVCAFSCADIHYEEIDESLWKMGLAYNRGVDRNDNHIGMVCRWFGNEITLYCGIEIWKGTSLWGCA